MLNVACTKASSAKQCAAEAASFVHTGWVGTNLRLVDQRILLLLPLHHVVHCTLCTPCNVFTLACTAVI